MDLGRAFARSERKNTVKLPDRHKEKAQIPRDFTQKLNTQCVVSRLVMCYSDVQTCFSPGTRPSGAESAPGSHPNTFGGVFVEFKRMTVEQIKESIVNKLRTQFA